MSESTNWSQRTGTAAKYHALRCSVVPLDPTTEEYNDIQDHVLSSQDRLVHRGTYSSYYPPIPQFIVQ